MGTHVSEESWFSRIGGAFKGILVGGVLCLIAPIVLFWNEGRAVKTAKGLKEGAKVVESVSADSVDPSREGKFIHISAEVATDEQLRDDEFGVEYNGIRLSRHVETYQWKEHEKREKEKKLGGGTRTITTYTYDKGWHAGLIDSSGFDEASTHQNPSSVPYHARELQAKLVHAGAFKLPDSLISQIRGSDPVTFFADQLPTSLTSRVKLGQHNGATMVYVPANSASATDPDNSVQTAAAETERKLDLIDLGKVGTDQADSAVAVAEPEVAESETEAESQVDSNIGTPQIGDTRVWFTATPVSLVSLMSQQSGESFRPYVTQTGTELHRLEMGNVSAAEMIAHAEHENMVLTWILRGVGTFVLFIGFTMLMRPLAVLADVVPMFGSIVGFGAGIIAALLAIAVSFTTIGIAWLFYRPLLGGALLAISGVCLFLIFKRSRAAAAARRGNDVETMTEMDMV